MQPIYFLLISSIVFLHSSCSHSPNKEKNKLSSQEINVMKSDSGYYFKHSLNGTRLFDGKMWDYAENFKNNLAIVGKKEDKRIYYGLINLDGESIVDCISPFKPNPLFNHRFIIGKDLFMGVMDTSGTFILEPKYVKIVPFSRTLLKINNGKNYYSEDVEWGLISFNGDTVLPVAYRNIKLVRDNRALVSLEKKVQDAYGYENNSLRWGYIDSLGKIVIEPQYEEGFQFADGIAPVVKNNKLGIINEKGETIIDFIYDDISFTYLTSTDPSNVVSNMYVDHSNDKSAKYLVNDKFLIVEKNKKWGYIDLAGNIIVPFKYDEVGSAKGKYVAIYNGRKGGIFDLNSQKEIVSCKYDMIDPAINSKGLFHFRLGDKFGYVDSTGIEVKKE